MYEKVILAAKSISVEAINDNIMAKLSGDSVNYFAIGTVMYEEHAVHCPHEFLNSLDPGGLPLYSLKLKTNTPIILLCILRPTNLCNGSRLQVQYFLETMS